MKRILFVSFCPRRGNTTGITGKMIDSLSELNKTKYEITLLDTNYFEKDHRAEDFKADRYIALPEGKLDNLIKKIPYFRSSYAASLAVKTLRQVLAKTRYDLVVIYNIPSCTDKYVKLCNKAGVKVLMYPWGSDILCCSKSAKKHIMKAFENTNFVGGAAKSNCILAAQNEYKVPNDKILIQKSYLTGVAMLQKLAETKNRSQMHNELNIPYSNYNIVCCYNGYPTHNHHIVIDAIIENKSDLPNGYQLVFPMTYGATQEYYENIKNRCEDNGLNVVFLREFVSNEQMAYLHLITDLFINIQDSDCGNAFMIEALYAKNRIITGKWLHYEQFEQFGIPYHLIDTPEDLVTKLKEVLNQLGQKPEIPELLIDLYRIPKDHVNGSYWMNIVDSLS